MTCGVLLYVHTGQAGPAGGGAGSAAGYRSPADEVGDAAPMSLSKWLFQATHTAGYEFVDLYSTQPNESAPLQEWPAFKRLQASVFNGTKPRLAVQVHANVPGLGDSLWDLYIHPWRHYLQSQGCELRLTTVLLLPRASKLVKEMALVGRAEQMD